MLSTHNYMFEIVKSGGGSKMCSSHNKCKCSVKVQICLLTCLLTCLLKLALPESLTCQLINVLVNFPMCMKLKMEVVTFC